jgi:spore coat polysaccharide biosynthesis protein SpsF
LTKQIPHCADECNSFRITFWTLEGLLQSVLAFLQARMGSTRLPGKVLMNIAGRSILDRAIARLRAAQALDGVVVLTTTLEEDDPVVREAQRAGADVFRGPAADVLARFQLAAEHFDPEVVVRATADNPLIDIDSVDRITRALWAGGLDYCMETCLPIGAATEVMTAGALRRTHTEAVDPEDREHVTLYIKKHPERFRLHFLEPPRSLRFPEVRVTVDTAADFRLVEALIGAVPEEESPVPLEQYLNRMQAAPAPLRF